MNKYFTIGEISKLFNIPIKTLRYYDDIELFKPAFIDKQSKYRYYSIDQFVIIDIIKNSKLMGMSLQEIKNVINCDSSIEDTLSIIENQINVFNSKISELLKIKNSMEKLRTTITDAMNSKNNEVFIEFNKERRYISYNYVSNNIEEQEVNLRRAILDVESRQREVYSIFGVGTLYEKYIVENKIVNMDIRYYIDNKYDSNNYNILPEGYYVSIIFDDNSYNKYKYYKKLTDYIINNNIDVVGDFSETWIIPKSYKSKEITLVKLEIMCKLNSIIYK